MTYTIEDVKRLVPEAGGIAKTGTKESLVFYVDQEMLFSTFGPGSLLLTARRKLEIAREALERVYATKYGIGRKIAREAIDAIDKEGES